MPEPGCSLQLQVVGWSAGRSGEVGNLVRLKSNWELKVVNVRRSEGECEAVRKGIFGGCCEDRASTEGEEP